MNPITTTASFLIAAFVLLSFLCIKIADRKKETFAWWLFLTLSLPIMSSLLILFIADWPETASSVGVSMFIADKFGILLVAAFIGSIGLLYSKDRPLGMLVSVIVISNINYITATSTFPLDATDNISIFFGSVIVVAIFVFVERNISFGSSSKNTPETADLSDASNNISGSYKEKTAIYKESANSIKAIAAYSLIGAGISSFIILVFSVFGGEQRAFFVILSNPTHLILPALLGAAMGFGYAVIKGK